MPCERCLELEGRLRAEQAEVRRLTTELEFAEVRVRNAEVAQVHAFGDSLEEGS